MSSTPFTTITATKAGELPPTLTVAIRSGENHIHLVLHAKSSSASDCHSNDIFSEPPRRIALSLCTDLLETVQLRVQGAGTQGSFEHRSSLLLPGARSLDAKVNFCERFALQGLHRYSKYSI